MNTEETAEVVQDDTSNPELMPARRPVENTAVAKSKPAVATPQQLRIMEVSQALEPAYQKASTLELTDAEIEALTAPFPDEAIEIRPHDGLIYLPHICISDRFNKVFKPGKWALICRRHWVEGRTMYGEYILLVRGCFVGESVGGHDYQPNNPKTNYSDTLESTAAEALRRIAGKRLSCGSQVWHPDFARRWVAEHAERGRDGKWHRIDPQNAPAPAATNRAPAPQGKPASSTGTSKNHPPATEAENKALFVNQLRGKLGSVELENLFLEFLEVTRNSKEEFFIDPGQMLQDVALEDLRALVNHWDKTVNPKFLEWQFAMRAAKAGAAPVGKPAATPPNPAPSTTAPAIPAADSPRPASLTGAMGKDPEWFMEVIVPIPHRGMKNADYMKNPDTIGSLFRARHSNREAMRRLMGFVGHYVPEGWTNPRTGVRTPPSEADKAFRVALDAFSDWYEKHDDTDEEGPPQTELAGMPASGDMPPPPAPDEDDVPF